MSQISRRAAFTAFLAASALAAAGWSRAYADAAAPAPEGNRGRSGGGDVTRALTPSDRDIHRKCFDKTMTEAPTGKTWSWKNPKTGNGGTVTPTSNPRAQAGQQCRTFVETITLKDGRSETIRGSACRKSDGSWEISA